MFGLSVSWLPPHQAVAHCCLDLTDYLLIDCLLMAVEELILSCLGAISDLRVGVELVCFLELFAGPRADVVLT